MTGIRADANETVAAGHMMRCVTIAAQLEKKGEKVLFFVADEYACPVLKQAGMEYICLHTAWDRMEEELPVFLEELSRAGCDRLLVDSYQATPHYLSVLRERLPVVYIDDLFRARFPADLLINYNGYYSRFPYEETYGGRKNGGTRLLLGPSFVPLREEFSPERFPDRGEADVKKVLISCGGGDVHNALPAVLQEALRREKLKGTELHVVVGRFNRNAGALRKLSEDSPRIRLHFDVSHMAKLMNGCGLAVSAAGTVLYELCAMRVPTVFFVCADNQEYDSDFFERENRMLFAGDIRTDRAGCVSRICQSLERLLSDEALRARMRKTLGEVTDGGGAERIAQEILRL